MSCEFVSKSIPLYLYGELSPDSEERLEDHCAACTACAAELKCQQNLGRLLDRDRFEVPPDLLAECRLDLARQIGTDAQAGMRRGGDAALFWPRFWHMIVHSGFQMRVPVGAMALVALGYFGARIPANFPQTANTSSFGTEGILSTVRSVQPEQAGRVQIAIDETRRRMISGKLDDPGIQRMLLAAVRDEANPGVRVESMDVLRNQAGSADVRQALLEAVLHDPNPGVRLKALDGLKSFAADANVRKTLSQVLLQDANPGVRIQVIDLLVAHHDRSMVGVLQNLVRKDDNSYVRARCENALQDLNASVGTF
ncbi:MAG: HEAT repeat domain-containing protein [Acidobacteriota bacterium]|nr:HEAT repeat domain-containing protein [Acidobacteriota bacterium]